MHHEYALLNDECEKMSLGMIDDGLIPTVDWRSTSIIGDVNSIVANREGRRTREESASEPFSARLILVDDELGVQ